jgi:eukaryotic-like serine/threonine-protein kinase
MELPGYKILGRIGEGGMSAVYKGVQASLNRSVAIKLLSSTLITHKEALALFNRESLIIAQLNHPNIIHVIDRGVTSEMAPYFVMEFIEGKELKLFIKKKALKFNQKIDILVQICKGLAYAHKNGVVHRDIKPQNILIDKEGTARILDFGIASVADAGGMSNTVMGTPAYMAPEQKDSPDEVTFLADIYALGVVMYELMTGSLPQAELKLPSSVESSAPKDLDDLIIRCLSKDPYKRPSSVDEIRDTLLRLGRGAHIKQSQRDRAGDDLSKLSKEFRMLDVISENQFGAVYLYEELKSDGLIVIKKRTQNHEGYKEAKLLTTLKHDNIVKIHGTSKNKRVMIIVYDYHRGGSLDSRLLKPFSAEEFYPVAVQICAGLEFAHNNRIYHGNLRPSNILFDVLGTVKIADFSLQEHFCDEKDYNWYMPYEFEQASAQLDVFSLGAIFYHMLLGENLDWQGRQIRWAKGFKNLPGPLQSMLQHMLVTAPERRMQTMQQVKTRLDGIRVEMDIQVDDRRQDDEFGDQTLIASDIQATEVTHKIKSKSNAHTESGSNTKWIVLGVIGVITLMLIELIILKPELINGIFK